MDSVIEPSPDEQVPATDDRDPAEVVTQVVSHTLRLAETWTQWDGRPFETDGRVYTPHKSIRRLADHLLDHLAEIDARLAGKQPQPDEWHASMSTTASDLARFEKEDLDEAQSRLTRIAGIWSNLLNSLTEEQLDRSPGKGWTFRQIAFHMEGSVYYADAVGDLSNAGASATSAPA